MLFKIIKGERRDIKGLRKYKGYISLLKAQISYLL